MNLQHRSDYRNTRKYPLCWYLLAPLGWQNRIMLTCLLCKRGWGRRWGWMTDDRLKEGQSDFFMEIQSNLDLVNFWRGSV